MTKKLNIPFFGNNTEEFAAFIYKRWDGVNLVRLARIRQWYKARRPDKWTSEMEELYQRCVGKNSSDGAK